MITYSFLGMKFYFDKSIAPSAPVQRLNYTLSSPFSVLIHWEEVPYISQNGKILEYTLITTFTDRNTQIPQLSSNFRWVNRTAGDANYFLLKDLWHTVDFTVTVSAINGYGPSPGKTITFQLVEGLLNLFSYYHLFTNFILLTETEPEIYNPERDHFFTQSEDDKEDRAFQCAAHGNPIPLINWFRIRNDKTEIDLSIDNPVPHELTIFGKDLEEGHNLYICRASNRQGVVNRTVNIVVSTSITEGDVIQQTNEQINNQATLNSEQAINLASLIDAAILQLRSGVSTLNISLFNESILADENRVITAVFQLFRNVVNRWDGDVSNRYRNGTSVTHFLFKTTTNLIQFSQNLQNGTTSLHERLVSLPLN